MWTLADCTGHVRRAVVAWKDRGRLDLTRPFAAALAGAARGLRSDVGAGPLLVVPCPSTAAARRRRGGNLVDALAAGVADGLLHGGVPAEAAPVLVRTQGHDQVGLGARERTRNLAGHVRVPTRHAERLADRNVLVVDDVLTTGATVAACRSRSSVPEPGSSAPSRSRRPPVRTARRGCHPVQEGSQDDPGLGGWFADGCGVSVGS